MKVSLWAEIRRLHEVERLSQAAIARRLHCSHRTVRKALAMASPPASKPAPREGILDRFRPRIDALLAKHPRLNAVRVTQRYPREKTRIQAASTPCGAILHRCGRREDESIRR